MNEEMDDMAAAMRTANAEIASRNRECSQRYVSQVQSELRSSSKLTVPKTRKGKDGKS